MKLAGLFGLCLALAGCGGSRLKGPPPPAGSPGRAGAGGISGGGASGMSGDGTGAATGGGTISGAAGAPAAGLGGQTASGTAGSSGGGRSGAGSGGSGGSSAAPRITLDPWPSTCLGDLLSYSPIPPERITSAGSVDFGTPALAGETITATLNGASISFSTRVYELFNDERNALVFGYGEHGEFGVSAFPLAPGVYACPPATLTYYAPGTSPLTSGSCCRIEVTKAGEVGDTIEGTFSGIVAGPEGSWIKVEGGRFQVVRRAPDLDAGSSGD